MSLTRLLYDVCGSESDAAHDRMVDLQDELDDALSDLSAWQARAWGETNPVWINQRQANAEVDRLERRVERIEQQMREVER